MLFIFAIVRTIRFLVLLKSTVSLLILCVNDHSIVESGVLKSPIIIILLFLSYFSSVSCGFIYVGAPVLGT